MKHLYLHLQADPETRNEFVVLDYWFKPSWWFDLMVFPFWGVGTHVEVGWLTKFVKNILSPILGQKLSK
jgi:hypothetical protein